MDAFYLGILFFLFFMTIGLALALNRLGEGS